jgi:hypothetical protein
MGGGWTEVAGRLVQQRTIFAMNKLTLVFLIGLLTMCGCAHQYVIKLNNGAQIVTASKPKSKGNSYYFKDAKGREHLIPMGRVSEIEPASMVRSDYSPIAQPVKKKHWYWPF